MSPNSWTRVFSSWNSAKMNAQKKSTLLLEITGSTRERVVWLVVKSLKKLSMSSRSETSFTGRAHQLTPTTSITKLWTSAKPREIGSAVLIVVDDLIRSLAINIKTTAQRRYCERSNNKDVTYCRTPSTFSKQSNTPFQHSWCAPELYLQWTSNRSVEDETDTFRASIYPLSVR